MSKNFTKKSHSECRVGHLCKFQEVCFCMLQVTCCLSLCRIDPSKLFFLVNHTPLKSLKAVLGVLDEFGICRLRIVLILKSLFLLFLGLINDTFDHGNDCRCACTLLVVGLCFLLQEACCC